MKEKIEQLAKGNFRYELPKLLLSMETIDLTIETGSTYQGSFLIKNSEGSRMKGVLYSSSRLLHLETERFIGEELNLRFYYIADYLNAGDEFDEEINLVTDCGEVTIPVHITIEAPYCDTSIGKVKDLYQFANLAQTDWTEAKQVFKSEKFEKVIQYYDKQNLLLYQSLVKGSSISQSMDEFLIAVHKKTPITISVDKTVLEYEAGPYNFMDRIVLTKEGWGYGEIRISTGASFLELERKIIWTDNFSNGQCEVNFIVKTEGMKEGLHEDVIVIETITQRLEIPIKVHCSRNKKLNLQKYKKIKHLKYGLMKNYLDFRFNHISASKYASIAGNLISNLIHQDTEKAIYSLYQLHLQLITGKDATAKAFVFALEEKYDDLKTSDEAGYALLLYLKTLQKKSENDILEAYAQVKEIYKRNTDSDWVFWCLLYLDPAYENNHGKKYQDIKQQYENGGRTPLLYYEACALLFEDPSLLRTLNSFEQQLMAFLIRQNMMTKEVAQIISYLIGKEKVYSQLNLWILAKIYEKFKLKEALQGILSLLIRGHIRNSRYHMFFEEGIAQQLRLTELPEYYVYTLDENQYVPLHPSIITYFNFTNHLPDRKKAFYYCCLLENAKSNEELIDLHQEEVLGFIRQQLQNGAESQHLAVLCDAFLTEEAISQEMASQLCNISFAYVLECNNKKIRSVEVYHKELMTQEIVSITDGKALIHLMTDNAQIILVDKNDQRFYVTVGYSLRKLCYLEKFYGKMQELIQVNPRLLLYLADKVEYYQKFDEQAVELRKTIALLPDLTREYRKDFIQTLIHYYYDNFEGEILESYLMQIDLHMIERNGRAKLIEYMIIRDLYSVALKAMEDLGYEGVDVKRLLKLCQRLISYADGIPAEDKMLTDISHYVFLHGKYDIPVLEYLIRYFNGTTGQMYGIWKTAKENNLDTSDLEERLLGQMLFAESYMCDAKAVFLSYNHRGCNRKLIRAFLSYISYKYLIFERDLEAEFFEVIRQELSYGDNEVALLALLKFYSDLEQLSDSEINFIDYHLNQLEQKGILLPFFQKFKKNMRIPQSMYDKYYIEYRTNPRNMVTIHYLLEDGQEQREFEKEEMRNCYYGIFAKEFILFNNEELQYYITERKEDGSEIITESSTIRICPEAQQYEENNYSRLNLAIEALDMRDEITLDELLQAYVRLDYDIDMMFRQI